MSVDPPPTLAVAPGPAMDVATSPHEANVGRRSPPWAHVWAALVALAALAATAILFGRGGRGPGMFVPALCLGAVLLAAGFDGATGRVPNAITYVAILLGLAINSLAVPGELLSPHLADHWLGAVGPSQAVLGLFVLGGVALVCRSVAGLGGGDAKLIGAIGAMIGLSRGIDAMVCALAVAAVYGVVTLVARRRFNAMVRAIAVAALNVIYFRDLSPAPMPGRNPIPLAIPASVGLLISLLPPVARAAASLGGG